MQQAHSSAKLSLQQILINLHISRPGEFEMANYFLYRNYLKIKATSFGVMFLSFKQQINLIPKLQNQSVTEQTQFRTSFVASWVTQQWP